MPLMRGNAVCDRVRPADPLKPGKDLGVIQVGIITAIAADDLKHVAVAAFGLALHDAGRLAPENGRPAMPWVITGLHSYLLVITALALPDVGPQARRPLGAVCPGQ
jgi:hypothetical protein